MMLSPKSLPAEVNLALPSAQPPSLDADLIAKATTLFSYECAKRLFDATVGVLLFAAAAPVLIWAAVAIKLTSPGPIFFKQLRPGRGGALFPCLKLRTMRIDSDEILAQSEELRLELETNGKAKHDPRITPPGAFLRKLSIDELPQLINVIRGEMSLVGPRPVLPSQLSQYGKFAEKLLTVRPGLTGLWQVSGRSDLSFEERIFLDMTYVDRRSMRLDILLLLRTVKTVLSGRGAY